MVVTRYATSISLVLLVLTVCLQIDHVFSEDSLNDKDEDGCGIGEEFRNGSCRLCKKGTYRFFSLSKASRRDPRLCVSEDDEDDFRVDTSDAQCVPCPRGTYNPFAGGKVFGTCHPCRPGTTSWRGAKRCRACPPGKSSSLGSPRCVKCAPGSFMTKPCQYGAALNTTCTKCPQGSYSSEANSEQCTLCPDGTSTVGPGGKSKSSCKPCGTEGVRCSCQVNLEPKNAVGRYRPIGHSVCTNCPPGTKARTPFATKESECLPCPSGTSAVPDQGCKKCRKGLQSFGVGASVCRKTKAGDCPFDYNFKDSDGVCKGCPAGYRFTGDSCVKCRAGTVSGGYRQKWCKKCEFPFAAPPNGESECGCARDHFLKYGPYRCVRCPKGTGIDKDYHTDTECVVDCKANPDLPQCTPCKEDYERDYRTKTCTKCKKGSRSLIGEEICLDTRTACPAGSKLVIFSYRYGSSLTCFG